MNNDLYSVDFTRALPPALKSDESMLALAKSLAEQFQFTAHEIQKNIIYARIDELGEPLLDILAYDMHVDWYDYSFSLEEKRQTIKDSVKIHRRLGTKYAVKKALGSVYPGTEIKEWFEYGGNPYMFKVIIDITNGMSITKQQIVLEKVKFYKNLRSHLEAISYQIEKKANVYLGACCLMGQRLTIYPRMTEKIISYGNAFSGGYMQSAHVMKIYPREQEE